MSDKRDKDWASLYGRLKAVLAEHGIEDAFGDADYWLVDDDYGGRAHKLCIHKLTYLSSSLIVAIQAVLGPFPGWHVLVQLEAELDGVATPPEGIIIYSDHVEQYWDRVIFANLARTLGI
ncbi:hypothetical protein KBW71_28065 [Hydrogenophaga aromaticivorans]|uniref:hypothetical protein n=1 Tax=Hydrogenophaga aromaticivorans TaxID=2610898 RepID=UPI001B38C511|nr:hypothetical protein [Hydrogenophaga aromaticivorans]MBQ0922298.1 hypothetical protein [Hydrogenophaga aromaticivorans]